MTSNDWNGITSKKPGTVLLMQNVDLGHTKVMQIRQRETLSHQGAIIHEVCCLAAQWLKYLQSRNGKFYNPTYSSRYRCYFMYFRSSIDHPRQTIDFYYSLIGLMVLFLFWEPNVYNKTIMISGNYNSKRSWAGWCDFSHGLYNQLTHIYLLSMIEKKS